MKFSVVVIGFNQKNTILAAINSILNQSWKDLEVIFVDDASTDGCAAFSAAVSDTLVPRVELAIRETGCKKIAVAGGVAANSRIRRDILAAAEKLGAQVYMPPLKLCGDNGAMIGAQAYYEYLAGNVADMSLNAYATKSILGEAL